MKKIKLIKKADAAVILLLLAAAAVFFFFTYDNGSAQAEIICSGEVLYCIDLDSVKQEYVITLDNGVKIKIAGGSAGFIESDCPGQDCVKCGMLDRPGQTAVCIPNETILRLKGKTGGKAPDAVAY